MRQSITHRVASATLWEIPRPLNSQVVFTKAVQEAERAFETNFQEGGENVKEEIVSGGCHLKTLSCYSKANIKRGYGAPSSSQLSSAGNDLRFPCCG